MARTRPSRARQPKFDRVDTGTVAAAAATETRKRLDRYTNPRRRLAAAVAMIEGAEADLARLRPLRNTMALSLALYDGVRAVNTAAGVSRNQMGNLRRAALGGAPVPRTPDGRVDRDALAALARARGVTHHPGALEELPGIAEDMIAAGARAEAARDVRDRLVRDLAAQGVKQVDLAAIVGRDPSRVSYLTATG